MSISPSAKRRKQEQGGNYINSAWIPSSSTDVLEVTSPCDGSVIGHIPLSNAADVAHAVAAGKAAFPGWSSLTVKSRAAIMLRFHALMGRHSQELAEIVVRENGKNISEALASVAKGLETVEWACSIPQLAQGKILEVSRGIECRDWREPLGVIASIVPFNFPAMVPMWTIPIALVTGNCVIVKPSEKVPLTLKRIASLFEEAGLPPGVFQIVNGTACVVEAICDHPDVAAVTFVGSSRVAELVSLRCKALNKRVLALGGAKNHLVALPDCDIPSAASDIVASFAGCAGQRCMAASVLLCVGECERLISKVVEIAKKLTPGTQAGQVGAVIDGVSKNRIIGYIDEAERGGAKILLDGRVWANKTPGTWVGPTVILHTNKEDRAMHDEIFGPVISVYKVSSWAEALEIENASPYGNAASIYTTSGAAANYFQGRFRAAMIGVNIGVPVPREPFAFGGLSGTKSKYGDLDITGEGALEFFTNRRKITTKWPAHEGMNASGSVTNGTATSTHANTGNAHNTSVDAANFVSQM